MMTRATLQSMDTWIMGHRKTILPHRGSKIITFVSVHLGSDVHVGR